MLEKMQYQQKCKRPRNNGEPKDHLKVVENQVCTLLGSIGAQHQALENAYSELEAERNASATAINEAMIMISRLQVEKSRLMMEASQFRREAEQKIGHAYEALGFYEDLLLRAEEEINTLQSEVQIYRQKFSSNGVCDGEANGNVNQMGLRAGAERVECSNVYRTQSHGGKIPMVSSEGKPLNKGFYGETTRGFLDQVESYAKECVECYKYEISYEEATVSSKHVLSECYQFKRLEKQSDSLQYREAQPDSTDSNAMVCNPRELLISELSTRMEVPDEDKEFIKHAIDSTDVPVQDKVGQNMCETKEESHNQAMVGSRSHPSKGASLVLFAKALVVGAVLGCLKQLIANRSR